MAGLYIHIPFCKSRCIYCGFYSTTQVEMKEAYVDALCQEMTLRPSLPFSLHAPLSSLNSPPSTIYIGGGTPSQLSPDQLRRLFYNIYKVYQVNEGAEITMECNPDDITPDYARAIGNLPVNRVSMGAQTFSEERLRFLHRRHTCRQVKEAVKLLRKNGIQNISIDLMFGFPKETTDDWSHDLDEAIALGVEHISAYSLMIEEGTPLDQLTRDNPQLTIDEEVEREMYETLIDRLSAVGYEHYEISNFARKGFRSRHNSSYWNGTPYIGIGAAAHSYDQLTRSWNVADLKQYIQRVQQGERPVEGSEEIDEAMRYNDLITTALRTCEGIDLEIFESQFSPTFKSYLLDNAQQHLQRQLLQISGHHLHLTRKGLFVSDDILSDLIYL